MPSSASDSPIRAPIRSSRLTSSQLVARLTAAAETNTTASSPSDMPLRPSQHTHGGRLSREGLRLSRRSGAMEASREGTPTRLPGSPESEYPVSVNLTSPRRPGRRRSSNRPDGRPPNRADAQHRRGDHGARLTGFQREDLRGCQGHGLLEPPQRALTLHAATLQAGLRMRLRQDRRPNTSAARHDAPAPALGRLTTNPL